jgi:hypothetical protein
MYDRSNTLGFAALLDILVIDLSTELEILVDQAPTPRDHFATLAAAKTLVKHEVTVAGVQMKEDLMEVREFFELKGTPGITFEVLMLFNDDLALVRSDVHVRGVTTARVGGDRFMQWGSAEKKCLAFENLDLNQFVATPKLLGPLAAVIFPMLFNTQYSDDFIEMAELSLDFAIGKHQIFIEGEHYGTITDHQNYSYYPKKGFHDLIELAALSFLNTCPTHKDIYFVPEPTSSKGMDLFLAVVSED